MEKSRHMERGTMDTKRRGLYNFAKECGTYANFVEQMREVGYTETPDKVAYNDSALDLPRLEELIVELS